MRNAKVTHSALVQRYLEKRREEKIRITIHPLNPLWGKWEFCTSLVKA